MKTSNANNIDRLEYNRRVPPLATTAMHFHSSSSRQQKPLFGSKKFIQLKSGEEGQ